MAIGGEGMREYLKAMREERGLSQQDVALKANITRQYYQQIEVGARQQRMDISLAAKLADAFQVPPERIIQSEREWANGPA